jgi:hypothetical protein
MKKTLLLLAAVIGFSFAAEAQLRPGFRLGANYSNMVGREIPADVFKYRLSYHGGVILNFTMGDIFSIQPEILYSSKGYTYGAATHTVPGTSVPVRRDGNVKFNYIDVPVMFRTQAGALYFELGPQISYLINSKGELANNTGDPSPVNRADFNAWDYGLAAGVGLDVFGANLGIRYNLGLNPIEGNNRRLNTSDLKHNVFMLTLGFMVPSGAGGGTMRPTY